MNNKYKFKEKIRTKAGTTIINDFYDIFIYEFANKKKNTVFLHFMIKPLNPKIIKFDITTQDNGKTITIPEVGIDSDLGLIYNKYDGATGKIDINKELWVDTYDLQMPAKEDVEFIEENVKALTTYLKKNYRHATENTIDTNKPWRYAY